MISTLLLASKVRPHWGVEGENLYYHYGHIVVYRSTSMYQGMLLGNI